MDIDIEEKCILIDEKYLIMDTETYAPSGTPNPEQDLLRYVGFKAYNGTIIICHYPTDTGLIQRCIDRVPYIVNHNLFDYDIPVMERHGFNFKNNFKIDTYVIARNRLKSMLYMDLNAGDKSLRALCDILNLSSKKGNFDYSILEKEILEGVELELLKEYLEADLNSTDELFKYFYNIFHGFKEYMSDRDKERMSWLTCSAGTTAYKAICNMAGLKEEYNDDVSDEGDKYEGGFVSQPKYDFVE